MAQTLAHGQKLSITGYAPAFVYAVLTASVVVGALKYDRRPPMLYIDTKIVPDPVRAGGDVTIQRYIEWRRICQGEVSTEVVSPKGYVLPRDRAVPYTPDRPGFVSVSTTWTLPADMLAEGDSIGTATYRGFVTFRDCGFTSWVWPVTVPYQERKFQVRR